MMLKFLTPVLFVFTFLGYSYAQAPVPGEKKFIPPVDFRMLLSGNFGELRGSHFHTGIDIKTKGTTGHNVYAVADGYVSRIKVSPYGYGNALYINHPNGYTSVYAHLQDFSIQIEDYVRNEQYANKSFAVSLFPAAGLISIKQGEIIGTTGNSGGSMGPHLHFEIRKTATEKPQNPLKIAYHIKDNISPVFHMVYLYPVNERSLINGANERTLFKVQNNNGIYRVIGKDTVLVGDSIGIGIYVNDYLNNSRNRCGVYDLMVQIDDQEYFHLRMDELSFNENRYVLSHMDYELKKSLNRRIHKCFIDQNNNFSNYIKAKNKGVIFVEPGIVKKVQIIAEDANGNKSQLKFYLKGSDPGVKNENNGYAMYMKCDEENEFQRDEVILKIPRNSLYQNLEFNYEHKPGNGDFCSNIHSIHNDNVPVHSYFSLKIKMLHCPDSLKNKTYLAGIGDKGNTWCASSSVSVVGDWAEAKIRSFGDFGLLIDTISPEIKPLNIYPGKDISNSTQIRLTITDSETGIDEYNGYIDDNWVLFEYDAKNDVITYSLDEHIPKTEKHILKVIVKDKKGNKSELEIPFTYKSKTS